jgi:hypothetical protein
MTLYQVNAGSLRKVGDEVRPRNDGRAHCQEMGFEVA